MNKFWTNIGSVLIGGALIANIAWVIYKPEIAAFMLLAANTWTNVDWFGRLIKKKE